MLILPKEVTYLHSMNSIEKERLKLLEINLRKLGNFVKNSPVEVIDYRMGEECLDFIFSVKDLDDTTFEFYNFRIGTSLKDLNLDRYRYNKNYQLTLKIKNSNFIYKYDFSVFDSKHFNFVEELRMIEVSYTLSEDKKIRLKNPLYPFSKIEIEEKNKKYLFVYSEVDEQSKISLLENFEKVVEKIKNIEDINLETLLPILAKNKKIMSIYICLNSDTLAHIKLSKGMITKYEINEANKKITVNLSDNITRQVEKTLDDDKITSDTIITEENSGILKQDYKRLFKEL